MIAAQSSSLSDSKKTVDITVTSDLNCAWCYVGLRKLLLAAQEANVEPVITFKPFLIQPHIPDAGAPKGGLPSTRVPKELQEAGAKVGVAITGLCNRTPSTKLFHAAVKLLQDDEEIDCVTLVSFYEAAFREYHTQGIYPDREGLLIAAKSMGSDAVFSKLKALFSDDLKLLELKDFVHEEAMESIRSGILGVPHFKFDEHKTFSGAQPLSTFELLDRKSVV